LRRRRRGKRGEERELGGKINSFSPKGKRKNRPARKYTLKDITELTRRRREIVHTAGVSETTAEVKTSPETTGRMELRMLNILIDLSSSSSRLQMFESDLSLKSVESRVGEAGRRGKMWLRVDPSLPPPFPLTLPWPPIQVI